MKCKYCDGKVLIRKGMDVLSDGSVRLKFKCKKCGRYFSIIEK
ncbi:MAG: hypothetical protein ACE5K4_10950 [Candidatus Hydrothermarchaeota archaeon]